MYAVSIAFLFLIFISRASVSELDETAENDDDDEEEEEENEETEEPDNEEEGTTAATEEEEINFKEENKWGNETEDIEWRIRAVKEVAYYLRAHKFGDFDRRFHLNETTAPRNMFTNFPNPPLRSLHWEVRKYCELNFTECLAYLHEKVTEAELQHDRDTTVLMQILGWNLSDPKDAESFQEAEKECQKFKYLDWVGAQPFDGPLERFQWRISASYYMCWHTMLGEMSLVTFGEPCDNFASCWNYEHGGPHGDPRADDSIQFQCAIYSFCPDPCCPLQYYRDLDECWQSEMNPCHMVAPPSGRQCKLNRISNINFVPIVLNHWNTSCLCKEPGFEWSSKFGICIDVDECMKNTHDCNLSTQACFNLPGTYACSCRWGYLYDIDRKQCLANDMLLAIENGTNREFKALQESSKQVSIVKYIIGMLFHKTITNQGNGLRSESKSNVALFILVIRNLLLYYY